MLNTNEITTVLESFYGGEATHGRRVGKVHVTYTNGVKCLQEITKCYWLIDAIASYQTRNFKTLSYFQVWCLKVNLEDKSAVLTCEDDNNNIIASQEIKHTGFPLSEIKIWVDVSDGMFVMLPSEY